MDIKVHTNISKEYQDIEVNINAPERNEQVTKIEQELLKNKEVETIVGMQNNNIFIINIHNIIKIYTEERCVLCVTNEGVFNIKEKLYYLEEILPKNEFIRISNSTIININQVKCFNTSIIGKIVVKFKNGQDEVVSRRRTSEIMKFLKERRGNNYERM